MEDHDGKCEMVRYKKSNCYCVVRKRNHSDFIRLWTDAKPAANYNKKAWVDVEMQLYVADVI